MQKVLRRRTSWTTTRGLFRWLPTPSGTLALRWGRGGAWSGPPRGLEAGWGGRGQDSLLAPSGPRNKLMSGQDRLRCHRASLALYLWNPPHPLRSGVLRMSEALACLARGAVVQRISTLLKRVNRERAQKDEGVSRRPCFAGKARVLCCAEGPQHALCGSTKFLLPT